MTVDELLKRMKDLSEDGYGGYPVVAPWGDDSWRSVRSNEFDSMTHETGGSPDYWTSTPDTEVIRLG